MGWKVDDIEAAVAELRERGVDFEQYDFPDLTTVDGITDIPGAYPSDGGIGERAAWFRDSEGNPRRARAVDALKPRAGGWSCPIEAVQPPAAEGDVGDAAGRGRAGSSIS